MDALKELLDDQGLFEAISKAETETEKMLIMLALIRNNVKSIKGWVTFFGVLSVISLVVSILF